MASLLDRFLLALWGIVCESAPALMLGFFLAGVLSYYLPTALVLKHLRARKFSSILKASAAGVPLPLCSCSVIPVALSLRKAGASRGATTSFFISTPVIGIDSALLTSTFFGPIFTVYRTVGAFFTAATVGWLVERFSGEDDGDVAPAPKSCCQHTKCSEESSAPQETSSRVRSAFRYGFITLVDDLAPLLLIGFVVSAAVLTFLPADFFSGFFDTRLLSGDWIAMLTALAISFPTYVCATASTPLVAALYAKGFPLGAGVVFLLAGPASNVSTMLAVRKALGKRAMAIYIVGVSACSLLLGWGIVTLVAHYPAAIMLQSMRAEHVHSGGASQLSGLVLSVILGSSFLRRMNRRRPRSQRAAASGLA